MKWVLFYTVLVVVGLLINRAVHKVNGRDGT